MGRWVFVIPSSPVAQVLRSGTVSLQMEMLLWPCTTRPLVSTLRSQVRHAMHGTGLMGGTWRHVVVQVATLALSQVCRWSRRRMHAAQTRNVQASVSVLVVAMDITRRTKIAERPRIPHMWDTQSLPRCPCPQVLPMSPWISRMLAFLLMSGYMCMTFGASRRLVLSVALTQPKVSQYMELLSCVSPGQDSWLSRCMAHC